ncbi:efflux RND transporter permease subunit [Frigoribacterium sp. CG_9.8]|uniref:efflux RND transporter permease subunit n=1 Tax=Frigoribacterium sp. CG_9.8 TaxID=2787733 RepID=UPI001A2AC0B8|nr:efflux RND transporter permease subunit [Frigoribacterium sp. CG_9.8]MBG6108546.1 HAE1 family hydrophobic/amphiphilic exporter-1 [Frigoribacterium sp. CG_9.8]
MVVRFFLPPLLRDFPVHLFSVFSLRNRALIALVTIVIGIFGGLALTSFKQELIPSLSLPSVFIVTSYPGASPDVVNTDISTPIESALQGIENLDSTTATSNTSASTVTASFAYGTDIATSEQKVQLALDRIKTRLPSSVTPQVITFSLSDLPVIQLAVTSDMDANTLASKLSTLTVTNLKQLKGVSDVSLLGAASQRVTITPDAAKLTAGGLSIQSIKTALTANGTLLASGSITEDSKTLTVQSGSRIATTDEIAALPLLGSRALTAPTIADVATVAVVNDPTSGYSSVNSKPAVTLNITKSAIGNTVTVSQIVRDDIPNLERQLGSNTKFTVVADQAPSITQSIDSLAQEGLLGLIFAVIIILVFLFSVRSTLVTAISIPVSVLITFIGMQAAGYTLNVITLAALTIAIGRVVDDSIVVIENIKRHIGLGEEKLPAILTAVREVSTAVTASTITTVAVFLPIALVGGLTGELFRPFALTVTMALLASLFVSLTIVPVLAYWFLGSKKVAHKHSGDVAVEQVTQVTRVEQVEQVTRLQKVYLPVIRWTLKSPAIVLVAALVLLAGSGLLATSLKTNFIGNTGQNTLTVTQTLPLGTSLETQDAASKEVEATLSKITGVDTVLLTIGSGGSALRAAFSGSGSSIFSVTTDPAADQAKLQATVASELKTITGKGELAVASAQGGFTSSDIQVNITAGSDADLRAASDAILATVKDLAVVSRASSNLSASLPYIAVQIDRAKAAAAGLSEVQVGGIVTQAMNPSATGNVVIDGKTLSIYVNNTNAPTTTDELKAFSIPTVAGIVPLSDLATVSTVNGPSSITTIKGLRSATITVTPATDNTGSASAIVTAAVAKASMPASATATLGGVTTQQSDSFRQLGLALLAAILVVYVVMVATFKSLRQPLLLLASIPFAATGAIVLQVVSGVPLGVASLIGVLMLIGIVVTNAIVLVDLINQYRTRGMRVTEAIINGASRRLRPILMTALATIFALLPLGIGLTGKGGFISQPLAIVVIGGLVSSTLLTLIVLPVLYYLVEGAKERRTDRRAAKAALPAVAGTQS